MAYMIDKDKYYKIKGSLLYALQELLQIYNYYPALQYNGNDDFKTIPMLDWEKQ